MENQEENWKPINGYEGHYEVGSFGNIKSVKKNIILKKLNVNGYLKVMLHKKDGGKQKYIHRLVAQYFIENKKNKPQVNHIDGDKKNNSYKNLEWVTSSENQLHSFNVLKRSRGNNLKGKFNKLSRPVVSIYLDGSLCKHYESQGLAAININGSHSAISACCLKKRNKYRSLIWMYLEDYNKKITL